MAQLTQQQSEPHEHLVQCRNAVETALRGDSQGNFRKQAAEVCDYLSHSQVDEILKADGDAKAILKAIEPAKEVAAEMKAETAEDEDSKPAPRTRSKK